MDSQFVAALEQLLIQAATPDSSVIKAATAKLSSEFYVQPVALPALLQIVQTNQNEQTRFLAAVEARKLVAKHWESLDEATRTHIKDEILKTAFTESVKNIRHQIARIIPSIAEFEFEKGKWTEIFQILITASTDDSSVQNKETAVFILFSLLESGIAEIGNNIGSFIELFTKTAADQSSIDVRIYSVLCLGVCSAVAEGVVDENPSLAGLVQNAIPSMVQVLKEVIAAGDSVHAKMVFNTFNDLLLLDTKLLGDNIVGLIQIMIEIALNTDVDEDIRNFSIQFLSSAVTFRKNKIISKKLGRDITLAALKIASSEIDIEAELDDEEDDNENEESDPSSLALRLIAISASELPPSQVVNTIFEQLPAMLGSSNQFERRAGVLSMGVAVVGAPDYYTTQLEKIMTALVAGLKDSELIVRVAALRSLSELISELKEYMSKYYEQLLPLLIEAIDSATHATVYKYACTSLDVLIEYMSVEAVSKYIDPLMTKLFHMLQVTENSKLRAIIVSAIGSTAYAAGSSFIPYFAKSIETLEPYIKDAAAIEGMSDDDIELRALSFENISTMARAVKSETFGQFAAPLIDAAYAAIQSDNSRLKESGFAFITNMAKVYGKEFAPFLPNILPEIYRCLEQEEFALGGQDDDENELGEEEDFQDNFQVHTGITIEKDIAAIALAELALGTKELFIPHVEKSVTALIEQAKESYGMRETALTSLWKVADALMSTQLQPKKFPKGAPSGSYIDSNTLAVVQQARALSIESLPEEYEFAMVTAILESITELLFKYGPIIVMDNGDSSYLQKLCGDLMTIIKGEHLCQTLDDEELADDEELDSSESDSLLYESALELLVALATALGPNFDQIFGSFKDIIATAATGKDKAKRITAVGALADISIGLKEANPYTDSLLQLLVERLQNDKSVEVRGNAAYGVGVLVFYGQADYSSTYPAIFNALSQLLSKVEKKAANVAEDDEETQDNVKRGFANACGCVARLALKHQDATPLNVVLPSLFEHLPLKIAFEENKPIFELFIKLYHSGNQEIVQYTPKVLEIFAHVFVKQAEIEKLERESTLGREENIDALKQFDGAEIKNNVVELLKYLNSNFNGVVSQNEILASVIA
ncbi:Importin subunit beta-4 [Cyberlindnera fabianii]|uniref:Importin subunit beta-4 n=1 Tax=Cyberlindnera fabianii TaxID=36022 RepID=A0A1V2L4X1_CYBFA|nr:Importin subunit beta-4 [Cyberlindnera fabianii]